MPSTPQQIIATVGPASRGLVAGLRAAGATAFRLNASHVAPPALARLAARCRRAAPDAPLVIDLQGAKMRLGVFEPVLLAEGDRVCFSCAGAAGALPLPHAELLDTAVRGDTLSCDDDRLRFRVLRVSGGVLEATALTAGRLQPRKGINVVEHPVKPGALSGADTAAIDATLPLGGLAYAFSFMEDGREADWVRGRAPGCAVIGKIERRAAAAHVHTIAAAVDALWICRGDLGAQLGVAEMARWVSDYNPGTNQGPVLMAGQVLEHMTEHATPTRSEVCHLLDLYRRGYSGFVLSDETAIGRDPVGVVRTLRALLATFAG